MEYLNGIYIPHTEVNSLILQVTRGCKYNKCTFCKIYRYKKYEEVCLETIEKNLIKIDDKEEITNVFLADADVFSLDFKRIVEILVLIKQYLPNVNYVSSYASAVNIVSKTQAQLNKLSELGLKQVYVGLESGNDEVLKMVNKNSTVEDNIKASEMLQIACIDLCTSVIIGIGGKKYFEVHSLDTAFALNQIKPQQIEITVLMHGKGSRLNEQIQKGIFEPIDEDQTITELVNLLENIELANVIFSTVHISNIVHLYGIIPRDKERFLKQAQSHYV